MSSQTAAQHVEASKISRMTFESVTWTVFGLAIIMATARTAFRIHTFRRIDADDCFLLLAVLTLSGSVAIIHLLYPLILLQNEVTLGQTAPGPDFPSQMLMAAKMETTATTLTWATIHAVKYSYLLFFRNLLSRARKMMWWWWTVVVIVTGCAIAASVSGWLICPHFTPDFFQICPLVDITAREHVWLVTTTIADIVGDTFIISIPVMILWNVKIPLRAKCGIAVALCLSLFMMIMAVVRISFGQLVPGLSDTVWIYFWWGLESSTAVFMVSATAFRSTFGHHQSIKASKFNRSNNTPMDTLSSTNGEKVAHGRPYISAPRPVEWYDRDDTSRKTVYQSQTESRSAREREIV